ncbi:TadE/TadG family type IV pilus assembly protein [Streptomyces sp. NPDC056716]|uniref:TadE/TadG family type IV pilus assembly protein n=1 Tax=unclassified Streptomyces TaxID=2593676 RepID=UPI0036C86D0A
MTPARSALTRRFRRALRDDRGSMSLFVLVTVVALFLVAALVYDGAGRLRALTHAEGVAQEAARAGGQAIDAGKAISGGGVTVDRNAAVAAARTYLSREGVSGTVSVSEDGGSLEVTVTESYRALFLGAASGTVTGHGSANLIYQG